MDNRAIPSKPANALQLINQKVLEETYNLNQCNFGDVAQIHKIIRYRKSNQFFAVGTYSAYDVTPFESIDEDDNSFHRFEPAISPAAYLMQPDEGRSGLLTWWYTDGTRRIQEGWRLIWGPVRWIRVSELDLSPQEVWQNIKDEIDEGETPLTGGGLPGWV
jgi:hypothetical protein